MKYLLDMHAIIWSLTETRKLPRKVKNILENPNNEILVSAISFWEISLKQSMGKLDLGGFASENFPDACLQMGFTLLPITHESTSTVHQLRATHHRDPFDRILIHLAIKLNIPLVSKDGNIRLPAKVFQVEKQHLFGYKLSKFFNRSGATLSRFSHFSLENLLFFNNKILSQEVY